MMNRCLLAPCDIWGGADLFRKPNVCICQGGEMNNLLELFEKILTLSKNSIFTGSVLKGGMFFILSSHGTIQKQKK